MLGIKAMNNKGLKCKSDPSNDERWHNMSVFIKNTSQEMKNIFHLLVWKISKWLLLVPFHFYAYFIKVVYNILDEIGHICF